MKGLQGRIAAALPDRVVQTLSQTKGWARNKRSYRFFEPLVDEIFPDALTTEMLVANDDAAVFWVEADSAPATIVKLARTPVADGLLADESNALDELNAMAALGDWRDGIAKVQARGDHSRGTWFSQTALPGVSALQADADANAVTAAAIAALEPVHRQTSQTATVTDAVLAELVSDPVALVSQWRPDRAEALTAIDSDLRRRLAGRELVLARLHGDFAPTNVLWDNAANSVSGIVDWRFSNELAPAEVDLVHFSISFVMTRLRTEYGSTVIRLLDGALPGDDAALVDLAVAAGPNGLDIATSTTLAWLDHVAFGLHKAVELRTNPIWLHNNVDSVIDHLAKR